MNTILGIWNTASKGKSSTCRYLADILIARGATVVFEKSYYNPPADFTLILNYSGKIIAIESQGDPGTLLEVRLTGIISTYSPDVIVTTCRTSGETVKAIMVFKPTHDILWSSTYGAEDPVLFSHLNQLKADHLFALLNGLGRI